MAIEAVVLSGSTNGLPIKVVATATAGTAIHTVAPGAIDEVTLFAENSSGSEVLLTLEIGGVTDPDNILKVTLPASGELGDGLRLVLPSIRYTGAISIAAFASVANVVKISGTVNRIV